MHFHVPAERLLGSATRRFLVFALTPFALDAFVYGVCMGFGLDPITAAFVGKSALLFALLAGLFGGLAVFMVRGDAGPPPAWEIAMRVLLAAAFIGMLAFVVGTGIAFVASIASQHGAATVALALMAAFAAGVLAFAQTLASRAFDLRGRVAVPVIAAQSAGLVLLGTVSSSPFIAIAAACIACLVLIPLLRFNPQPPNGHA
jgi:hypothetical protein